MLNQPTTTLTDWIDALHAEAHVRRYTTPTEFLAINSHVWVKYFNQGMSPTEALNEDERWA